MEKSWEDQIKETTQNVKLIILKDTTRGADKPDKKDAFRVHGIKIKIGDEEQEFDYYKLQDIKNYYSISIIMRENDEDKEVELPDKMLNNISTYFGYQNVVSENFDCKAFAHFANGIPTVVGELDMTRWTTGDFDSNIKPGETITINETSDPRSFTHWAIYLGDGLYLSKFGKNGGPLIVASLDEMKKGFGGDVVTKMTPQK